MKATKKVRRDAKRLYRVCLVDGLLDPDRARRVVQRVSEAGHRNRLAVLSYFRRLVKLDQDRHAALVQSALPLPPDLRATIQGGLTTVYGPGLSTTFVEDPGLIGGVRIAVASDVYDGSVRGALASLESEF
jgi:F-type H+-transporting ATPase subunit delta